MLKKILEKAYKKENMQWRVYSFNPEKDNELVYTSKAFDCIADAQVDKVEQLKKHPNYVVEISTSRVEESSQKNEAVTKSNYKNIINDLEAVFKKFAGGDLKLEHKKKPNSFDLPLDTCLSVPLKDKAKLEPVKAALKKVIDKYGAKKVAHKDDFAYNFGETNKDGIYVGWNWNADRAFLGYAVNPDFDVKYLSEATQKNEAKYKLKGVYYSADGQDKFKVDEIIGNDYKVTYNDGTKATLSEKEIDKWIAGESANIDVKNPGVLEVPDGKKVDELPQSHFEKLVDKKGYAEVIRALTNLEVWNKDKNKSLSLWASNMADKLKKKFRPESAQKNEDTRQWYKLSDITKNDKPFIVIGKKDSSNGYYINVVSSLYDLTNFSNGIWFDLADKAFDTKEQAYDRAKSSYPKAKVILANQKDFSNTRLKKYTQESAQKNEDYKKPKSFDELKAGEWYKFNGEIRQIADRQPIDNEIQMFKVFSDLHVGNGTHAAYKSLFKPTDFVYVDKRELINKAIKERESQIAKLKLEIDALKKSL